LENPLHRIHKEPEKGVEMKARVNSDLCTGCGPCEEVCPEVFQVQDNVAVVITDPVPLAAEESCREAMDNCPTEAITIEE